MFGLFRSKNDDRDKINAAIRKDFDQTIAFARIAPLSKQARVGKGIIDALSYFNHNYTKESFQKLKPTELRAFIDTLAKKQDELRLKDGDVALEHIGYSLVSRWTVAVAMGDDQLVKHFDDSMLYFKRAAQTNIEECDRNVLAILAGNSKRSVPVTRNEATLLLILMDVLLQVPEYIEGEFKANEPLGRAVNILETMLERVPPDFSGL